MRKHQFEGAEVEDEVESGKGIFTYREIFEWGGMPNSMKGSPYSRDTGFCLILHKTANS